MEGAADPAQRNRRIVMRIIAGTLKGHNLFSPKGEETRPTSSKLRGTVFNMLQQEIEDAAFLDIFSGSGAMGIEALSRGARFSVFIDASKEAFRTIERNIEHLELKNSSLILLGDFLKMLDKLYRSPRRFDILFTDAPYDLSDSSQQLIDWLEKHPLVNPGGRILIEDTHENPPITNKISHISTRKSGKTFLHDFRV